jgi:hypothetical protein
VGVCNERDHVCCVRASRRLAGGDPAGLAERDRSAFEADRYPANAVTPQPVDETQPRNCPTCQTIEWWCVPNATARRILWHGAGHPSDQGEAIIRDEIRYGGEQRGPGPVHYTSPSAVIACGEPITGDTVLSPERSGVTCPACRTAMDGARERRQTPAPVTDAEFWGF